MEYKEYWEARYRHGENSGAGSYGRLAQFKAQVINGFIRANEIDTVLDFGCGDGNQTSLIQCSSYFGIDISRSSINICKKKFADDTTKNFKVYYPNSENDLPVCELVLCLDCLYHIIPETEFIQTLDDVFSHAEYMVILYTILSDIGTHNDHIYTRDTMKYIEKYIDWEVTEIICQEYPKESGSDFIILEPCLK